MIHGRKFSKVWGQGVPRNGGREGGGLAILHKSRKNWRVMEVLSRSLRNEEASHINIWGKSFSRRNGKHKDPEIGGPWCIRVRAGRQVWWNRTNKRESGKRGGGCGPLYQCGPSLWSHMGIFSWAGWCGSDMIWLRGFRKFTLAGLWKIEWG